MRAAAPLLFAALLIAFPVPALAVAGSSPPSGSDDLAKQRAELEARGVPSYVWQIGSDGAATHRQTGLVCPAAVGSFVRVKPTTFDRRGLDVGCDYETELGASVTLYLTQRHGQSVDDDLAKAQTELGQYHPDYTLLPAGPEGALSDDAAWRRAMYDAHKGTTHSGIWIRDLSGWTLEYRATYATGSTAEAVAVMETLTKQAVTTAGTHLSACAAAAPIERKGTEDSSSSSVMAMTLMSAVPDDSAPAQAENWCVEPVTDEIGPTVFWRNIASDEHSGAVDRLTIDDDKGQDTIVIAGAPLLSIVDDQSGHKDLPLAHVATLTRGTKVYILAIYRGRPSAADVFGLARDLFGGKRQPLAVRDGKNVTVTMPQETH